jgi:hypothetical protein
MVRWLIAAEIILIALGVGLTGLGYWQARYPVANAGALTLGLGAVIGGLETIISRRIHFTDQSGWSTAYGGLAAAGWGLTFVAMGAIFLLFGATRSAGREEIYLNLIVHRPSVALLPLGFFLFGTGMAGIIGPMEGRLTGLERLISILNRAPAVILLAMSLAALGVGGLEFALPAAFDRLFEALTGVKPPDEIFH